jgi:hypothetical protein
MAIPVAGNAATSASTASFSFAAVSKKVINNRVLMLALAGGALVVLMSCGLVFAGGAVLYWKLRSKPPVAANGPVAVVQPTSRISKFQEPGGELPAGKASDATAKKQAWLKRTLVDAYDRSGKKNPKWDADARELLRLTAEEWVGKRWYAPSELAPLVSAFRKAEQAGCDDPLILYAGGRFYDNSFRHDQAAQKMEASSYHPVHRAHALLRAAQWYASQAPGPETTRQINRQLDSAIKLLPEIAKDKEVPTAITVALLEKLQEGHRPVLNDRNAAFDKINFELEKAIPNSSVLYTFQGKFYINWAWDARGSGWANTVTEDGWRVFGQRLAQAQTALEKAWQLDPTNSDAATAMITVELGQGHGRDLMEQWFKRAMTTDPDNYQACSNKLYYLEPKWHGSPGEMLAFARECRQGGNWKGRLPFIMVEAHQNLAQYNRNNPAAYFLQPEVWPDIKSVFEPYLKQNPNAAYERSRYAFFAGACGQWDESHRQFTQLGKDVDQRPFGDAATLEQFRRQAAANAKSGAQGR